jgi:hypothetical protein
MYFMCIYIWLTDSVHLHYLVFNLVRFVRINKGVHFTAIQKVVVVHHWWYCASARMQLTHKAKIGIDTNGFYATFLQHIVCKFVQYLFTQKSAFFTVLCIL